MKTQTIRRAAAIALIATVTAAASILASAAAPKFFEDDPMQVMPDTQDASGIKPMELKLFSDLAFNIVKGSEKPTGVRAENVNTVDEVPDSSWFTNRAGVRTLTSDDVARGPNTTDGPAAGTWMVTSSKSDGITPGFTVLDPAGQRWFLKFDPAGHRGMTTGTEVAVSKLMWALGYHVPENHIASLRVDRLAIAPNATVTLPGGVKRAMKLEDVTRLLSRADAERDGSYRVVASKALPGTPVGRIRFFGTRPDDPNDLVAHENRRELRGYGVFAAWLNHVDAKAINSLDTLVTMGNRSIVRHHLIDFGSALGSGGIAPAEYWEGGEYLVDPKVVAKQMAGFGFYLPKRQRSPFYEAKAIGRFPARNDNFDPDGWKPRVPNPAFINARADDQFWAARKMSTINAELIRSAIHAGQFGDADAERFLVQALIARRDAIIRTYLPAVNPIVDPVLNANAVLSFRNAAVDADVARAPQGYRAVWFTFDNATRRTQRIAETTGRTTEVPAPARLPEREGAFIKVELTATGAEHAAWSSPVDAYFRLRQGTWHLVGFERLQ